MVTKYIHNHLGERNFQNCVVVFCEVFRNDVVNNPKKGNRKVKMEEHMINGISGRELFDSSKILSHFIDEFLEK